MNLMEMVPVLDAPRTNVLGAVSQGSNVGDADEMTTPVSPATPLRVNVPAYDVFVVDDVLDDGKMMALVAPVGTVMVLEPTERVTMVSALTALVMLRVEPDGPRLHEPSLPPVVVAMMLVVA